MKKITMTFATIALTISIFSISAFADCGDQTNGSRCLAQPPVAEKTDPNTTSKTTFDLGKEINDFFRSIFGSVFGKF